MTEPLCRHAPGKLLSIPTVRTTEPPAPEPLCRADIAAQGKCLAVLQRAGHVVHVGKSGT